MRIRVLSDLHLETPANRDWRPPAADADVVVLAGDTAESPPAAAAWATAHFEGPVVGVLGNHEFFGSSIAAVRRRAAEVGAAHPGFRLLDDDVAVIGGVRFVGATLWTDFALFGEDRVREAMSVAKRGVPDFDNVLADEPRGDRMASLFGPREAAAIHLRSRRFLDEVLSIPFAGPTVVVTHHAPSMRSVSPLWQTALTSAAWASDLDDFIERRQPDLWIHGHVHDSADYRIGRTRVVCNPRGFGVGQPRFDPSLVVEVGPRPEHDRARDAKMRI